MKRKKLIIQELYYLYTSGIIIYTYCVSQGVTYVSRTIVSSLRAHFCRRHVPITEYRTPHWNSATEVHRVHMRRGRYHVCLPVGRCNCVSRMIEFSSYPLYPPYMARCLFLLVPSEENRLVLSRCTYPKHCQNWNWTHEDEIWNSARDTYSRSW